jgi:hypothetical protein
MNLGIVSIIEADGETWAAHWALGITNVVPAGLC